MAHEGSRQARDRGVTRSKVEKARPSTQPQVPQVPQVDIVPGRLNEAEWIALMALEEGEDVVGDILADLLSRVMDCAFKVYLTQQCIPFTISQAREAMLQIIEWRFLARDEGETAVAEDPTWGEDEEPLACTTDAWAQGSVPVLHAPATVGLEEHVQGEDHGNADQFAVGPSWLDRSPGEEKEPSEPSAEPPPPTLGESQEAVPQDALERDGPQGSPVLAKFSKECLQPVVEGMQTESPQGASPQALAEKDSPPSRDLYLEDLNYCVYQPDAAGDRPKRKTQGLPRAASIGSASTSSGGRSGLSSHASFQPPTSLNVPLGRSKTIARLDPARLPRHCVYPLVEVLDPDPRAPPLETYGRDGSKLDPWKPIRACGKTQPPKLRALHPRADPKLCVSPAEFHPLQPCVPFPALGSDPTLDLGLSSSLGSKLPFLSPGLRFLAKRPVPPDVERSPSPSPSPKLWPGAKWPSGWEGEAELLGELWAGRTRVLPQGMESAEKEDIEDSGWPQMVPQFLEATSQELWKPLVPLEVMQLAPGVSMRKSGTQEWLTSVVIQEEAKAEGTTSHAEEQLPIQTDMSKSRVTMTHLLKKETPKAWLIPAKPVSHSGS